MKHWFGWLILYYTMYSMNKKNHRIYFIMQSFIKKRLMLEVVL